MVSFTDGQGPSGYTELSASRFAAVRGAVDAMNVLPFLVGSGTLVARSYPDQTVAYVKFVPWQMVIILAVILVIGLVAGICVPVLPFEIPRRGFGLYSWIALLKSQVCYIPCSRRSWNAHTPIGAARRTCARVGQNDGT